MKLSELTAVTNLIEEDTTGESSYIILNCPQTITQNDAPTTTIVTRKITLKDLAEYLTAISAEPAQEETT